LLGSLMDGAIHMPEVMWWAALSPLRPTLYHSDAEALITAKVDVIAHKIERWRTKSEQVAV
jgi:hypothetical protein